MKLHPVIPILLLAATGLMAQSNIGGPAQYTGTMVDEQGRPVAGAEVDCYHYPSRSGFGYWDREPKLQQTTVTDGKGAFAVSASAGTILVVVKKAGLATVWKTWSPEIPDSTDPIVLTAPATLSGMVVDDNDKPVADAEVWVVGASIGNDYGTASQLNDLSGGPAKLCFAARTGPDGRFRIENFPADGRAGLAIKKAGMARHTVGSELGGETDCQPGQALKLVVGLAGSVEGKVIVAETGQPLGGVKIQLDSAGPGVFYSAYCETVESRADGTFHVPDVQPGKHYVRASISGGPIPDWVLVPEDSQVTVVASETTRNVVVHFSKGALVEVTVVVTNRLTPLANVAVSAGGSSANTDTNGKALLRVPAGTNWFSARKDWLSQNKTAAVDVGQTNHVRFELTPPPKIAGTVRDLSGVPAAGVLVSFHPGYYPNAPDYAEVMTDENGRYEMKLKLSRVTGMWSGPITSTNFVMAQDFGRNLAAIQEFGTDDRNFNGLGIIPSNLDLTLQPGITLTGSVKDTEGAPVTNATVDIHMLAGHSIGRLWPQPVKVDAHGSFTLPALPQGREYEFWQGINAKGYGTAYGRLEDKDSKTNHYEFPAFVLKRADRKLAGQILGRDGKPVVGAMVNMSGQGQSMFREAKSDGQGHFHFDGVCAGEVRLNARYYPSPDYSNGQQGDVSTQGGDTNVVVRLGIYASNTGGNLSPPIKLTGTVRDARGKAVAGVKMFMSSLQSGPITSQTDSRGRYEFTWQKRLNNEETEWLLARDLSSGSTAFHQMDETTTNLDLTLQEGMTLSVRVSDTDGQRLTNATASVGLRLGNRGFGVDSQPFTADERGQLRITALPQGERYMLQIQAPGHTSNMRQIAADETKTKLLELPPVVLTPTDCDVAGQVLDNDGKPAAGVNVHLYTGGQTTTTDTDGHFVFHGVRRGLLSLEAGFPMPNTSAYRDSGMARANGGDTNIVIRLGTNPSPASSISRDRITTSGTAFDPSGMPAPGVILSLLSLTGFQNPVRSDAGGKYTMQWQNLSLRTNKVVMFARDLEHNWAAAAEMDAKTANLDIHLQPGLTLSGSVQNSRGRPVTNAIVQLVPFPPADPRAGMNRQSPTNATARGTFSFTALPQGVPYAVRVSADGYWTTNIRVAAADTKVEKLELPKTVLELADQQVAGQVLGLSGKPCWGAEVTIEDEDLPSKHASHTDSNGHFVISGVRKGLLNVRATFSASGDNPQSLLCTNQVHGGDKNVVLKLRARQGGAR
jgi:protocatechuate 3,4-dioxygenase beta subunit